LIRRFSFFSPSGSLIATLFAWAYELTPAGLKRTEDVLQEESIARQTGQRLNYIVIALFVGAVLGSGSTWLLGGDTDGRWREKKQSRKSRR